MKIRQSVIYFIALLFTSVILLSCERKVTELEEGTWRATLKTQSGVEIPFNFSLTDSAGKKLIFVTNAEEKIKVDEIVQNGDSVIIQMPFFDSEIRAKLGSKLEGKWIKRLADRHVSMDFAAEHGVDYRFFETDTKSDGNVSGRWSTTFVSEDKKDTTIAVGEFEQKGTKLTGTFLTSTGDYRYLEGTVSENKMYLSTFNGSNAYLFTGDIQSEGIITNGKFYGGLSSIKDWTAKRDDNAILPDSYSLTGLKPGYSTIDFSYPNLEKKEVSLSDPKFKNKIVIAQFLGSWCPNCIDEIAFLSSFYKEYKNKGVEIVGLAYERTTDFERSHKNLSRLKDRFDIDYDILITGFTKDNEQVLESMPMLSSFNAFPTTIIIDKNKKVRKIHTGFSGPGTGIHYTKFKEEFEQMINDLLEEG